MERHTNNSPSRRVFVMMSGGVDSSVAAYLLKKSKKYEVIGAFIKGYNVDGCQEKEAEDARRAAEFLDIPFYVFDLEKEYKKYVVDYLIDGYKNGITPNPDVMCNKEIKFGLFLEKALEMGADYVATGHYARSRELKTQNSKLKIYKLAIARDLNKDQSYFLWTLTQEQLKHCLFPIGNYLKPEVRRMAKKAGLPTAEKKDSQGICFLGKVKMSDFLKEHLPVKSGDVVMPDGKKIGKHQGAWFYTIGQRHIGVNKFKFQSASRRKKAKIDYQRLYVSEKNIKTNTLTLAEGNDNPILYKKEVELTDVNFVNPLIERAVFQNKKIKVWARVRYRQPLAPAMLVSANRTIHIIFDNPQKAVASGQSAVFYSRQGELLGGGIIADR